MTPDLTAATARLEAECDHFGRRGHENAAVSIADLRLLLAEQARVTAECERLREALGRIIKAEPFSGLANVRETARRALAARAALGKETQG